MLTLEDFFFHSCYRFWVLMSAMCIIDKNTSHFIGCLFPLLFFFLIFKKKKKCYVEAFWGMCVVHACVCANVCEHACVLEVQVGYLPSCSSSYIWRLVLSEPGAP